jgi:hypothetical protein
MTDLIELKRNTDLIAMIENDLGAGKRCGSWMAFRCPFHEDSTPSLMVKNGSTKFPAFFKCYGCGEHGDVFSWLMKYRKHNFVDALKMLGGELTNNPVTIPQIEHEGKAAPAGDWQASATEAVHCCKRLLWSTSGEKARAWLNARGLKDVTLRTWNIGYSTGMKISGLWVPAGIVLPCWAHDRWWYLKIRQATGKPKYIKVKGSSGAALWGLNFPWAPEVFKFEGEFDQMLFWQECRDFTNAFTLGSATDRLDPFTWGIDLLSFNCILDAGDNDSSGQGNYAQLLACSGKVRRAEVPSPAKDITDFWKAGGNIKTWAWYQIRRAQEIT